mmetsp:Transcript_86028/g.170781  ORF Transcript_86028/g.170781 Transcript_86028/m.170781 type:complete len:88 (+) Transcript_86028:273-536(+)
MFVSQESDAGNGLREQSQLLVCQDGPLYHSISESMVLSVQKRGVARVDGSEPSMPDSSLAFFLSSSGMFRCLAPCLGELGTRVFIMA